MSEPVIDCTYLVETLSWLARIPTEVRLGYHTLLEPDDPKLVHYVQDVLRPELVRIGIYEMLDVSRRGQPEQGAPGRHADSVQDAEGQPGPAARPTVLGHQQ